MKNIKQFLKGAVILLITVVMLSSTLVIANTDKKQISDSEAKEIWLGYNEIQPQSMAHEWFQYDDGVPEYVIGWATEPLIAQFAIRLTNVELAAYDGYKILGVEWYHAVQNVSIPTHDYDMMIYEGNETLPLVQIVNESDNVTGEGYAYHEFIADYTIDASKDTWIVCRPYVYNASETGDYPVGYDANEASWYEGKSSWRYRIDLGGWYQYHPAGLNGSWCLHVKIQTPDAAICCEGSLVWEKVKGNSTVNGTFQVCNCGENGSFLNWEVDTTTLPNWSTSWIFTPASGTGLAYPDCVTVTVEVVAPPVKRKTFTGTIKIINSDNTSDFCEIDVSLTTPRARTINGFNLMQWILQKYPNMFPILRNILA